MMYTKNEVQPPILQHRLDDAGVLYITNGTHVLAYDNSKFFTPWTLPTTGEVHEVQDHNHAFRQLNNSVQTMRGEATASEVKAEARALFRLIGFDASLEKRTERGPRELVRS